MLATRQGRLDVPELFEPTSYLGRDTKGRSYLEDACHASRAALRLAIRTVDKEKRVRLLIAQFGATPTGTGRRHRPLAREPIAYS